MTTAYARAMTFSTTESGVRRGVIDDSWHQGRGAFGGLLAAMTLRAMMEDVSDPERLPRSLTVHFCGPASGPFDLVSELVRAGSRVTHATARITTEKGVSTFASASFCKDRPDGASYALATMPDVKPASELRDVPRDLPGIAAFFQHVEARFAGPTFPFSSSPASGARVAAWVRLRDPVVIDAPVAALLLDSLPPAITATFGVPRAVASVDFTVQFFTKLTARDLDSDHYLVSITSRWAGDGYTEELRDLWSPRGELLAQCRQLIALL